MVKETFTRTAFERARENILGPRHLADRVQDLRGQVRIGTGARQCHRPDHGRALVKRAPTIAAAGQNVRQTAHALGECFAYLAIDGRARHFARQRRHGAIVPGHSATGPLVFLPLAAWLADTYGWHTALVPALLACAIAGLLAFLFIRDRPSDMGLLPYGETPGTAMTMAAPAPSVIRTAFAILRDAAQTRTFWVLFGTFFICGLSTNGLIQTHFIPFCSDFGIPQVQAASVLAGV